MMERTSVMKMSVDSPSSRVCQSDPSAAGLHGGLMTPLDDGNSFGLQPTDQAESIPSKPLTPLI